MKQKEASEGEETHKHHKYEYLIRISFALVAP